MTRRRETLMDQVMAEPIPLPGAPQLIVTRGWAYQWLKKLGYPLVGGFGSVDYMVFGGRNLHSSPEPLTDLNEPWAVALIARMEEDVHHAHA